MGIGRSRKIRRTKTVLISLAFLLATSVFVYQLLRVRGLIPPLHSGPHNDGLGPFFFRLQEENGEWRFINTSALIDRVFPKEKDAETFRVILLGASFAQGAPYFVGMNPMSPKYGDIISWVQALLEMRFPSGKFDMINATVNGIDSGRLKEIVKMLAPLRPDIMIVITSNNEGLMPPTPMQQLHESFSRLAAGRLFKGKAHPFDNSDVTLNREYNRQNREMMEKNTQDIIAMAQKEKISLILGTIPINLKLDRVFPAYPWPKFESDDRIERGIRFCAEKRYTEALNEFENSGFHYYATLLKGECLEAMGRYEDAMKIYVDLVENKPMGRVQPAFNAFLRKATSGQAGVYLADAEKAYLDHDPHGMPDPGLFWDNCHMKWRGYLIVAREIVRVMIESGLLTGLPGEPLADPGEQAMIDKYHWHLLNCLE